MGNTHVEAQATGPARVEVTITLDAEDAQNWVLDLDDSPIESEIAKEIVLDAVDEAYEWELAEAESEALRKIERRKEIAAERERPAHFYRE